MLNDEVELDRGLLDGLNSDVVEDDWDGNEGEFKPLSVYHSLYIRICDQLDMESPYLGAERVSSAAVMR